MEHKQTDGLAVLHFLFVGSLFLVVCVVIFGYREFCFSAIDF
jgi:hypothetical protein